MDKKLEIADLYALGILHLINKDVLHPMGLFITIEDNQLRIFQSEQGPLVHYEGGFTLVEVTALQTLASRQYELNKIRRDELGFIIQPLSNISNSKFEAMVAKNQKQILLLKEDISRLEEKLSLYQNNSINEVDQQQIEYITSTLINLRKEEQTRIAFLENIRQRGH